MIAPSLLAHVASSPFPGSPTPHIGQFQALGRGSCSFNPSVHPAHLHFARTPDPVRHTHALSCLLQQILLPCLMFITLHSTMPNYYSWHPFPQLSSSPPAFIHPTLMILMSCTQFLFYWSHVCPTFNFSFHLPFNFFLYSIKILITFLLPL